jgi:transposase
MANAAARDLSAENETLKRALHARDQHIAILEEKLRLALHKRFAASSEKAPAGQLNLFNEAEAISAEAVAEDAATTIPEHKRRKRGRKPLPDHIPRTRIEHDIPEDEKLCACGCRKSCIGEAVSEQLDIVPAKIQVLQHVRLKYACRSCEGVEDNGPAVVIAPLPPQPIPKSNASPSLLAHIVAAKFLDGLPLYRLETMFARIGIELPRATLANWIIRVGDLIRPLINLMQEVQLGHDVLQMDETTVQVLKEKGRAATSKSYMWVRRGGPPSSPVILYTYDPSRSSAVPLELLADFKGYLQTDGYEGYSAVAKREDIIHVGCLAHAKVYPERSP